MPFAASFASLSDILGGVMFITFFHNFKFTEKET